MSASKESQRETILFESSPILRILFEGILFLSVFKGSQRGVPVFRATPNGFVFRGFRAPLGRERHGPRRAHQPFRLRVPRWKLFHMGSNLSVLLEASFRKKCIMCALWLFGIQYMYWKCLSCPKSMDFHRAMSNMALRSQDQ